MILGIGSDIIDIRRIERTLARFGDRFTHRVYTELERARLASPQNRSKPFTSRTSDE